MNDSKWNDSVAVLNEDGQKIQISSVLQAAEFLVLHWPEANKGSQKHLAAQAACLDVLEGKGDPEHARAVFQAAAQEAKLL